MNNSDELNFKDSSKKESTSEEIEALIDIAITFDELGMSPTIPCDLSKYEGHFVDVFKTQFDIIRKGLERLKQYENKK